MSLGQLTANYTDSEGEDEARNEDEEKAAHAFQDLKLSAKSSPINKLVSYANEDDDEDQRLDDNNEDEEPDELLNSEPMDTGTDEGEDDKSEAGDLGIKLPPPPLGKCSARLQERVAKLVSEVQKGKQDYNASIQNMKDFRNPSIYEKLIDHLQLDEMGSNYPLDLFDPHCWGRSSYYDELAKVQKEEMEKKEKERKEKTKVDIISGTKKPIEEEAKKRKSRFDQAAPGATGSAGPVSLIKSTIAPPTLTTVPSGTKTTIDAFGGLKRK